MKCTSCRKEEVQPTWWEDKKYKLMHYLFGEEVKNLAQEKYTQGFGDGHKMGYLACINQVKTREEVQAEIIKEGVGSWLQPFKEEV